MRFKNPDMIDQLQKSPAKLQEIAKFLDDESAKLTGKGIVITRVWDRTPGEATSVHEAHRAFDVRVQFAADSGVIWYFTEEQAAELAKRVNVKFHREDNKLTCLLHKIQGGLFHLHVQLPFNWLSTDEAMALSQNTKE